VQKIIEEQREREKPTLNNLDTMENNMANIAVALKKSEEQITTAYRTITDSYQ
jgi:hypothetical protein